MSGLIQVVVDADDALLGFNINTQRIKHQFSYGSTKKLVQNFIHQFTHNGVVVVVVSWFYDPVERFLG